MSKSKCKVLFVGNLPYECTEEQLLDVFEQAGPVASVRLVYDRDSNKPRGFGFCEFFDHETASIALRNLSSTQVGGRSLRLDYADPEEEPQKGSLRAKGLSSAERRDRDRIQGVEVRGGEKSDEVVAGVVRGLGEEKVLEVLRETKALSQSNPERLRSILSANPQLTFALVQCLIQAKIEIHHLPGYQKLIQELQSQVAPAQLQPPAPVPQAFGIPPNQVQGGFMPPQPPPQQAMPAPVPLPVPIPIPQPAVQAPVNPLAGLSGGLNLSGSDPAQLQTVLTTILTLTPEQIDKLPTPTKETVLGLRARLQGGLGVGALGGGI